MKFVMSRLRPPPSNVLKNPVYKGVNELNPRSNTSPSEQHLHTPFPPQKKSHVITVSGSTYEKLLSPQGYILMGSKKYP